MKGSDARKIRALLKLTQVEMAARIGVTSNTVARWERGEVRITEPMARLLRSQAAPVVAAQTQTLAKVVGRRQIDSGEDDYTPRIEPPAPPKRRKARR